MPNRCQRHHQICRIPPPRHSRPRWGGQRCSTRLVHPTSKVGTAEKWGFLQGPSPTRQAGSAPALWHGGDTRGGTPQEEPDPRAVRKSHVGASFLEKRRPRGSPPKLLLSISAPRTLPRRKLKSHQCRQPKLPLEEILSPPVAEWMGKQQFPPPAASQEQQGLSVWGRRHNPHPPGCSGEGFGDGCSHHHRCSVTRPTALPAMLMSLSLEWEIPAAAGSDWHVQSQVMPLRPQNHKKKKGLFLALKALNTCHPQLLRRELLSFFSWLSPPEVTSDATGRSWESRVGGCGHPPRAQRSCKERRVSQRCPARPGTGGGDKGSKRQLCPPNPSLAPGHLAPLL